jgi:hypothetical protein
VPRRGNAGAEAPQSPVFCPADFAEQNRAGQKMRQESSKKVHEQALCTDFVAIFAQKSSFPQ